MKKVLFLFVCLFCFFCKVNASDVYLYDINEGDKFLYGDKVDVFLGNAYGTTFPAQVMLFYIDKNENLLEAFTVNNVWYFTWAGTHEYSRDMYLDAYYDFSFGKNCIDVYSDYVEYEEFGELYDEACNDKFTLYSSQNDISKVKVWNVKDFNTFNEDKLMDLCNDTRFNDSFICDNIGYFDYGHYIVLNEYNPATFELVCEPKEVKKDETSNCELKVNASEEINELTIPMNSDLFDITKYNEVEGWILVDNKDGTITIKSEDGFKGEGVVLGATLKFKEDLTDNVEIELNDIHYITADGIELNGSAKDNITIYEEPVIEDSKEEVDNPNTIDNVSLVSVIFLLTIFIALMIYRMKKI